MPPTEAPLIRFAHPDKNCVLNAFCNASRATVTHRRRLHRECKNQRGDGGLTLTLFSAIILQPQMQDTKQVVCSTTWFVSISALSKYSEGVLLFGICGHCLGIDATRGVVFDPKGKEASNVATFSSEAELGVFLLPRGFPWIGTTVLHIQKKEELQRTRSCWREFFC
jgi:hypothetical protein